MNASQVESFTVYAGSYDIVLSQVDFYRQLHMDTAQYLKGCPRLLDLGTGTGNLLTLAKNRFRVGIDRNPDMLRYAAKKRHGARLCMQAIGSLGFTDSSFDALACLNVLYTEEKPVEVLAEFYRVLAPTGLLVLSGPVPNPDLDLLERKARAQVKDPDLVPYLDRVVAASRRIIAERRNTLDAPQLERILTSELGFESVVKSHHDYYHGQSYFLIAKK